ncbi:alpha/beta fold hydrolase [Variovorax paradoxus]|uniref:alpha/beta fold hydrolase n=1 Tax=Variovorax paradoxus TaxID=34073 RepID=UPI003D657B88
MLLSRRAIISSALAASGAALAGCSGTQAEPARVLVPKSPFLLVHGAWHGTWCWGKISPLLAAAGHPVLAIDLPGHGLNAAFPAAFYVQPRTAALATELSPIAGITLADYARAVANAVDSLLAAGFPAPIVVGHSMGGGAIHAAAELLGPGKIARLVYLAAFMPKDGQPMVAFPPDKQAPPSLLTPLLRSDPGVTGALRLDPASTDDRYRAGLINLFYGKVDAATARAALNLLSPDIPIGAMVTPIATSVQRWGAIPRTYIRTSADNTIPPAIQDLMVAQADTATPANKTQVLQLDSDHSPFLSMPQQLVRALLSVA